jgi:hypothetical protein
MKTNNFKHQRAYGIDWLKNATKNDTGAQNMVIASKGDDEIVVKSYTHTYGHMFASITKTQFIEAIKYDFNLMEIITDDYHKVFFDIDAKTSTIKDKSNYRNLVSTEILKVFPSATREQYAQGHANSNKLSISGSENDVKYSYHIVLPNYMVRSVADKEKLKLIVKKLKETITDIDTSVYSKNRAMKFLNQSKPTTKEQPLKRIQKIITNDDTKDHCITAFFNEEAISISDLKLTAELEAYLDIELHNKSFDISTLPKIKKSITAQTFNRIMTTDFLINIENITPFQLLQLSPLDKTGLFNHSYTFFVMLFCYSNNITPATFLNWYSQKTVDENKHQHKLSNWSSLEKYKRVSVEAMINMLSVYYPELKIEKTALQVSALLNLTKYQSDIQYINNIQPLHFQSLFKEEENQVIQVKTTQSFKDLITIETENNTTQPRRKYTFFNIGMGSGKTTQTISFVKRELMINPQLKFLFITPNITLGRSLYRRLKDEEIPIEHYDIDYKAKQTKNVKHKSSMCQADNLVICANSIHYLDTNRYDFIIADEFESTLHKWFSNKTLTDNHIVSMKSWKIFLCLLEQAKQVICLDAFTTNLSVDFVKSLAGDTSCKIYQRKQEVSDKKIRVLKGVKMWLNAIIHKLNKGEKVFIYYPYNKGNSLNDSMSTYLKAIQDATGKKGIAYNADCDDIDIKELDDVMLAWSKVDFVMTNSKITVGINYERNDFDCVFLSLAGFSSPRDVVQASCRCRSIKSNTIYLYFIDSFNSVKAFTPNAYLMPDCPIYDALADNIIIEKLAPLKGTFFKLCKIAGYKIEDDDTLINDKLDIDITQLLRNSEVCFTYDNIVDIDNTTATLYKNRIIDGEATAINKLQLKKYFFKKKFIETDKTNNDDIAFAFNNNYFFFLDTITNSATSNIFIETIFDKMKTCNKWNSIFPTDDELKKVKLDDDVLDMLFKPNSGWVFKNLKRTSGHKVIVKDVFNITFQKQCITSKTDKSKHTSFHMNKDVVRVYDFALINLRKFNNEVGQEQEQLDEDIFLDDD